MIKTGNLKKIKKLIVENANPSIPANIFDVVSYTEIILF